MILTSPGDVAFSVFGFPIYYYGIILAFACFVAVFIAKKVYEKYFNFDKADLIWEVAPFVLIFGIVGARLYYCFLNFDYYLHAPLEIFNIRGGGLSIHGGILAGVLGLWIASLRYKINFLTLLDIFSIGTVFAQGIGRFGNFFNNEAFGLPYEGAVKLFIPLSHRPDGFQTYQYFHPAFLYESIADFVIFFILLYVIKTYKTRNGGLIFCLYMVLYSVVRFFIEGIRIDSALNIGNIHVAQLVSAGIFLISLICLLGLIFKNNSIKSEVN